jgi:hypothetical protein
VPVLFTAVQAAVSWVVLLKVWRMSWAEWSLGFKTRLIQIREFFYQVRNQWKRRARSKTHVCREEKRYENCDPDPVNQRTQLGTTRHFVNRTVSCIRCMGNIVAFTVIPLSWPSKEELSGNAPAIAVGPRGLTLIQTRLVFDRSGKSRLLQVFKVTVQIIIKTRLLLARSGRVLLFKSSK